MTTVPHMSELYRQLLNRLTGTFGGRIDDANADAIAYAAAELYHRDFEPRLWEEKSAHDLLDLFGVPRAGVFSPYSLSERVLIFQRRSTQAEYVNRAHDLLTALGVPRQDETGTDQSLKWRLDWFVSAPVVDDTDGQAEDDAVDAAVEAVAAAVEVVAAAVEEAVEEAAADTDAPAHPRPGVVDPLIIEHPDADSDQPAAREPVGLSGDAADAEESANVPVVPPAGADEEKAHPEAEEPAAEAGPAPSDTGAEPGTAAEPQTAIEGGAEPEGGDGSDSGAEAEAVAVEIATEEDHGTEPEVAAAARGEAEVDSGADGDVAADVGLADQNVPDEAAVDEDEAAVDEDADAAAVDEDEAEAAVDEDGADAAAVDEDAAAVDEDEDGAEAASTEDGAAADTADVGVDQAEGAAGAASGPDLQAEALVDEDDWSEEVGGDDSDYGAARAIAEADREAHTGLEVDLEPGAAPLVEAVRALEHAARVEAELAQAGPTGVPALGIGPGADLARLTSTLNSIHAELSALRTLIDSLGVEIRERLDILHEEILVAQGRLGPETSPGAMRAADVVTRVMPPVIPPEAQGDDGEPPDGMAKKAGRRVLLVVLLVLLGVVVAGTIVAGIVFGWDQIRSQVSGLVHL